MRESFVFKNGVILLEPQAVVAVGPHSDKTALYTAAGVILVDETPSEVAAAITGEAEPDSDPAPMVDDTAPPTGTSTD